MGILSRNDVPVQELPAEERDRLFFEGGGIQYEKTTVTVDNETGV